MHKYGKSSRVHYHDYAQKIRDRNLCTSMEEFFVRIIMIMHAKKN